MISSYPQRRQEQHNEINNIGSQQGIQLLLQLTQLPNLSLEQTLQAASALHQYSLEGSKERELAKHLLLQLADKSDLTYKQSLQLAVSLYKFASNYSLEELVAFQLLWKLVKKQSIPIQRRLEAVTLPFRVLKREMSYFAGAEVVQLILFLLPFEKAQKYLSQNWLLSHRWKSQITALDIPYIIELANQEALPKSVRNEMYLILRNAIPQYGYIGYQAKSKESVDIV